MNIELASMEECTGCFGCVCACDRNCITIKQGKDGFLYPEIEEDSCVKCGKCITICLSRRKESKNSIKKCYAAWADDEVRYKSSSGGIFTILAEQIIAKGGAVCGAAYVNGHKVKHIIIYKKEDIVKLQTSKYVQSDVGTIYREIKKIKKDKKVLFVGTPCQVAGLYAFLKEETENLITVDLCCHGVPSQFLFDQYLKEEYGDATITDINFRDKRDGWTYLLKLAIKTSEGEKVSTIKEDSYYKAFSKRLSLRKCCGTCVYANDKRLGDVTLGDFWRIWDYKRSLDDRKGTSLILINSNKGEILLGEVKKHLQVLEETSIEAAKLGNITLSKAQELSEQRDAFLECTYRMSLKDSLEFVEGKKE